MALELLNLSDVLINMVFGGVFLTYVGMLGIIVLIAMLGRLTPIFLFYWGALYTLCFGMIFFGAIVPALITIIAIIYFTQAIMKWSTGGMT